MSPQQVSDTIFDVKKHLDTIKHRRQELLLALHRAAATLGFLQQLQSSATGVKSAAGDEEGTGEGGTEEGMPGVVRNKRAVENLLQSGAISAVGASETSITMSPLVLGNLLASLTSGSESPLLSLVPALLSRLKAASDIWDKVETLEPLVRQRLAPLVKRQSAELQVRLAAYQSHDLADYKEGLASGDWRRSRTGAKAAFKYLDEAQEEHAGLAELVEEWAARTTAFECADAVTDLMVTVQQLGNDLEKYRTLWRIERKVASEINRLETVYWESLIPDDLEVSCTLLPASTFPRFPSFLHT